MDIRYYLSCIVSRKLNNYIQSIYNNRVVESLESIPIPTSIIQVTYMNIIRCVMVCKYLAKEINY